MTTTDRDTTNQDTTTNGNTETTTNVAETTTENLTETTTNSRETTTDGNTEGTTTDGNTERTTTDGNTERTTTESNTNETTTESNREETTTESNRETTTDSMTTTDSTTTDSSETTTMRPTSKPSNGNSSCPPIEEGQAHFVCPTGFRRHPQDCQMFYQCTQSPETSHLSIVTFNCPNNTVYDEEAVQCRDKRDDDNCPMKSTDSLRSILFGLDDEDSPLVRLKIYFEEIS